MFYKLPDGQTVEQTAGFEHNGFFYSPNPRRSSSELLALGAVEVVETPVPNVDPRFYYVSQIGDPVPRPMDEIKTWMKSDVKRKAGELILDIAPEYKQRNLTARAVEIALTYPGRRIEQLPTEELQAEATAGKLIWDKIKDIRTKSNEIETQIDALQTVEEAETFTWSFSE